MIHAPVVGQWCHAVVEYWGSYYVMFGKIVQVRIGSVDVEIEEGVEDRTFCVCKRELFEDAGLASQECAKKNGIDRGNWTRRGRRG